MSRVWKKNRMRSNSGQQESYTNTYQKTRAKWNSRKAKTLLQRQPMIYSLTFLDARTNSVSNSKCTSVLYNFFNVGKDTWHNEYDRCTPPTLEFFIVSAIHTWDRWSLVPVGVEERTQRRDLDRGSHRIQSEGREWRWRPSRRMTRTSMSRTRRPGNWNSAVSHYHGG